MGVLRESIRVRAVGDKKVDACQVEQAKDWDAKDNCGDGKDDGDLLG